MSRSLGQAVDVKPGRPGYGTVAGSVPTCRTTPTKPQYGWGGRRVVLNIAGQKTKTYTQTSPKGHRQTRHNALTLSCSAWKASRLPQEVDCSSFWPLTTHCGPRWPALSVAHVLLAAASNPKTLRELAMYPLGSRLFLLSKMASWQSSKTGLSTRVILHWFRPAVGVEGRRP